MGVRCEAVLWMLVVVMMGMGGGGGGGGGGRDCGHRHDDQLIVTVTP